VPRGERPGALMQTHISIGIVVLLLIVLRFAWRESHRVAPEPGLPPWQRHSAEALHWILYLLVFITALTGWFYASARGFELAFFGLFPLPALVAEGSAFGRALGSLHEKIIWVLAAAIALHVLAALAHAVLWKDGVLRRMLP
jgi:cytochrome b561